MSTPGLAVHNGTRTPTRDELRRCTRPVPELPTTNVFHVRDAQARGWTSSGLKNAVRQGRLIRVRRGVYASADPASACIEAWAAVVQYPNAVVSHRSAALLHGLPLLGPQPPVPEVTVRPRGNANLPGMHVHRARLREHEWLIVNGVAVTSVARTVVDLARHRQTGTAVAAIDAALHRGRATLDEIDDVLRFCSTWPGIVRARRAVLLSDHRSESPLESVSRLAFPRLGLPAPAIQASIFDQYERFVGRSDFYWDEFGVVGEADGRAKYTERPVLTAEKDRQEEFEDLGLGVVRWGWDHATRWQHLLRIKLQNGFKRGRQRDESGFPRLWTL